MHKVKSETEAQFLADIEKHRGLLHKICLAYSDDSTGRDDLKQEIILQLWKSYPSFRRQSGFSTWMYRVALNTAISLTKKKFHFISLDKAPDIYHDTDITMNLSEDVRILYKAISYLDKIEKAIVLLWLEDRSYEEISGTVGISVKNVSVRLVRIKTKLAGYITKLQ